MTDGLHGGRVAIVTGGGGGIGRAVAVDGPRQRRGGGCQRRRDEPRRSRCKQRSRVGSRSREITAAGGIAIADAGSVTDPAVVSEIVQTAVDQLGSVDILVNVAGIMRKGTILDTPFDDWTSVTGVHLTGTFNTCRAAAPIMAEADGAGSST